MYFSDDLPKTLDQVVVLQTRSFLLDVEFLVNFVNLFAAFIETI